MGSNTIEVQIAVAKVGKYASSESGDTVEMIERPRGGVSVVVADGQMSGKGAKRISNLVVRKTLSLLAEGVRDGAAARAAHDYLYAHRGGAVQATLNIVSVDLDSKTVVISRNSHCPVIMMCQNGLEVIDEPSSPVGIYPYTKPHITEVPISPFLCGWCLPTACCRLGNAGTAHGHRGRCDGPAAARPAPECPDAGR